MANTDAQDEVLQIYQTYRSEAQQARFSRLEQNKLNFDCYHLHQDFSDKREGQSTEFLPKLAMAVEQTATFMQQGLIDMGDWFKAYPAPGLTDDMMRVKSHEIQRILTRQLSIAKFMSMVGDATKLGLLGSVMIAKIGGRMVPKPKYVVERYAKNGAIKKRLVKIEDKKWQLKIDLVRQEDFYMDPSGKGLYLMQDIWMDYYEVLALSKGEDAIYDRKVVEENLKGSGLASNTLSDYQRNRETGQDASHNGNRKRIKVTEIWGNFLNSDGELVYENCVASIANDTHVIQKPTPNPLWHGEHPYAITPILSVPGNPWGKALCDAPAALNMAANEMFNLMLDGGQMAVHGIKQLREHWLEDPSQVADGIAAGETLRVNTSCPPGQTALERVDTSTIPTDGINIYNLLNQEFVTAAMTNDLRMGVEPFRQVKATEIVESSQSITSMLSGMSKNIEANWIVEVLRKGWCMCAQHMDDFDSDEVAALIGKTRADEILKMGPEELFAATVQGFKIEVFGISATLNKQKDFTKLQSFLQTLATSPILMQEFAKSGGDFGKLLIEIVKSLDLNWYKIQTDEAIQGQQQAQVPQAQPAGATPDMQSQIPQAGAAGNQGDMSMSSIPQTNFPASRATPRAGM